MEEKHAHNIVVVGDNATCTGFRLAGIQEVYAVDAKGAKQRLDDMLSSQSAGIIIINERIVSSLDQKLKKRVERVVRPVIITVPDKNGPIESTDSIKSMVKRALGFELIK